MKLKTHEHIYLILVNVSKRTGVMFLFCCTISFGQNLVPNPGFEQYLQCPSNLGQLNNLVSWSNFGGSPDYYNSCANGIYPLVSVPTNYSGYQWPASGNGYCGIYTFYNNPYNYREYFGSQLLSPLVIGKKYCVEMKVNLSLNLITTDVASNNIGILFTTSPYSAAQPINITNYAHVYSDSILTDTTFWKPITGEFIADSAYTYIAIGNFFDNSNTDTIQYSGNNAIRGYILIDDVSVIDCDSLNYVNYDKKPGKLIIHPNPVHDFIDIQTKDKIINIAIFDTLGYKVEYLEHLNIKPNGFYSLNIQFLQKGIYIMNIQTLYNQVTRKIIKL